MKKKDVEFLTEIKDDSIPSPKILSIYDAWRQKKITQKEFENYLKQGYPRTQIIEIK